MSDNPTPREGEPTPDPYADPYAPPANDPAGATAVWSMDDPVGERSQPPPVPLTKPSDAPAPGGYPAPPPPPYGSAPPPPPPAYGSPPPPASPPAPPPVPGGYPGPPQPYGTSQPYGSAQPYGGPAPYGAAQPGYGQQQSAQPYGYQSSYSPVPLTAAQQSARSSAILWTILNGVSTLISSFANLLCLAGTIVAAVAIGRASTDAEGSRRLTKISIWLFAIGWGLIVLFVIGFVLIWGLFLAGSVATGSF